MELVQIDDEAEQVEMQRPERQIEDRARACRRERDGDGLRDRPEDGAEGVGERARDRADRDELTVLRRDPVDVENTREGAETRRVRERAFRSRRPL